MPDFIVHAVESSTVRRYMPDRSSIERVLADVNAHSGTLNRLVLPPRIVRRPSGGGIAGGYETHVSVLAHRSMQPGQTVQSLAQDTARVVREALNRIVIPPVLAGDDVPTNWTSVTATEFNPVVNGPLSFWEGAGAQASVTRTRDDVSAFSTSNPENPDGPDSPLRHQEDVTGDIRNELDNLAKGASGAADQLKTIGIVVAVGIGLYAVSQLAPAVVNASKQLGAKASTKPRKNPSRKKRR